MCTPEERDAKNKRSAEQAPRRETRTRRIKDIVWTAVLASVITIVVVTALSWLTTQAIIERAREESARELVALRSSICQVRFQQRSDAEAKLAEFRPLSWGVRNDAIRKFITEEGLATMLGEDAPAPGAIDRCTDAIVRDIESKF